MTSLRRILLSTCLVTGMCAGVAGTAWATPAFSLPDPTDTVDGIPVAAQYHDFYSYSSGLLAEWDSQGLLTSGFGPYDFASGTGTIPVIVYTGANGATNPGISDPLGAPSGGNSHSFDGIWGDGVGDNGDENNKTTTVGSILGFLQLIDPSLNTPVFFFDHAEPGSAQSDFLYAFGQVDIIDTNGTSDTADDVVAGTWCFDILTPGSACGDDASSAVLSPASISVQGTSGTTYDANNNQGSGKPDYFILPIGMDLTQYGQDFLFTISMHLRDIDGGFEELGIGGVPVGGTTVTDVPEPAALGLFGLGLLGLGLARRRKA
jgi:hypothetical protein